MTNLYKCWPEDWPKYHNANVDACDNLNGPCACGAWHQEGEFEFKEEVLYRYGREVKIAQSY